MENTDILILILMFATPIVSAILDRKKKAKKKAAQAARRRFQRTTPFEPFTAEDIDLPEEEEEEEEEEKVFVQPAAQPKTYVYEPFAEGAGTTGHNVEAPVPEPVQDSGEKEKIDVRKLIVYDAIMNPKFKE